MEKQNIYQDISARTGGEIYLGVVGPVRSGKSTFIKRFMELLVLPEIKDENERKRTMDELPQSGTGKMVMTTEPKFIPKEAAELPMEDMKIKIRLIDCVGFMIPGAGGNLENGQERLVKTPWFDYEVPFTKAAEFGTPLYVFHEEELQETTRRFQNTLGKVAGLCYAMKANPFLVKVVEPIVDRIEVCSMGEFAICEEQGVAPEKILVSGVLKKAENGDGIIIRLYNLEKEPSEITLSAGRTSVRSAEFTDILEEVAEVIEVADGKVTTEIPAAAHRTIRIRL